MGFIKSCRYLEQNIGILAANFPLTKALLQKKFIRLGGQISSFITKRECADSPSQSASSKSVRLDIEAANRNQMHQLIDGNGQPMLFDVSGLAEKEF
jgi:hypothetical protein